MLTGTGHRSPPCKAVSNARSAVKVKALMIANPSMFGATTLARPNGSTPTIAVVTAVNRAPRAALFSARTDPACDMSSSLATLAIGSRPAVTGPANQPRPSGGPGGRARGRATRGPPQAHAIRLSVRVRPRRLDHDDGI